MQLRGLCETLNQLLTGVCGTPIPLALGRLLPAADVANGVRRGHCLRPDRAVWYHEGAGAVVSSHYCGRRALGPVAQLGARLHGMQKVRGSNPLRSTTSHHSMKREPFSPRG